MKNRDQIAPPAVGGSALLVIFSVLCLTVFALLSLSTVQAEQRQADAAAEAVREYYDADLLAQETYARLRSGETVEHVRQADGSHVFEIPISRRQLLTVRLEKEGEIWRILQWQAVPVETESDEGLDVWKGTEEEA